MIKRFLYISIVVVFTLTITSCGSTSSTQKSENEVAGYTLKNKQELMEQKVFNSKVRTVIANP